MTMKLNHKCAKEIDVYNCWGYAFFSRYEFIFFIEAAHSHNNALAQIIASLFGKIECRQLVREILCNRCVHASHFYVLSHKK